MFGFFKKASAVVNVTETIDVIENAVYAELKPLGFRKYGRTLHRFVSGDISQVINFQNWSDSVCGNIGIRIPECAERTFHPETNRKYYREEECTIRSRLGVVSGKRETWYDLSKDPKKTGEKIIAEIKKKVIPAFGALKSLCL